MMKPTNNLNLSKLDPNLRHENGKLLSDKPVDVFIRFLTTPTDNCLKHLTTLGVTIVTRQGKVRVATLPANMDLSRLTELSEITHISMSHKLTPLQYPIS